MLFVEALRFFSLTYFFSRSQFRYFSVADCVELWRREFCTEYCLLHAFRHERIYFCFGYYTRNRVLYVRDDDDDRVNAKYKQYATETKWLKRRATAKQNAIMRSAFCAKMNKRERERANFWLVNKNAKINEAAVFHVSSKNIYGKKGRRKKIELKHRRVFGSHLPAYPLERARE